MAQQLINVGTTANDGTGDLLRNGFIKVNQNFTELYTNRISGSGTDNYIPRFNGTNALENSIIFDNGTNVGIGTTSPAYKLEVNGSINVYPNNFFRYDGDTGIIGSATSIGGGASNQLGIRASNDILFATNGANERMRLNSSGNVGIGTSNPTEKLHVAGVAQILDDGARGRITFQISSTQNDLYSTTTAFDDYRNLRLSSNELILSSGGTTERMRILSNGNVGIGTTSPSSLLQIEGVTPFITINKTSGLTLGTTFKSSGTIVGELNLNTSNGEFKTSSGFSGYGGFLTYYTDSSERMRITSAGNVGIGATNTFGWKTFINSGSSSSTLLLGSSTSGVYISLNDNNSTAAPRIGGITNDLVFTTSNAERMRITSGGILQIGSGDIFGGNLASDYGGLTLRGGYGATSGSASKIEIRGYEGGGGTQGALIYYTNGTERMRVMQSGNVYIGKTSGSSKFGISGLPTSSAGLSSGDIWNDGGTLKIV